MRVTLAIAHQADQVEMRELELPAGATLADALRAARFELDDTPWSAGVWGRTQPPGRPLQEGDRVELTRPLRIDPKQARRQRVKRVKRVGRRAGAPRRPIRTRSRWR